MAKYNIYGHVLYSEIEYEKLMYMTEKIFIQSLLDRVPSIKTWVENIWDNIDHEYMIKTLEEIKRDIIAQDMRNNLKFAEDLDKNKPLELIDKILEITKEQKDEYKINPIENFKKIETKYAEKIARVYKKRVEDIDNWDEMTYLTEQVKNFHNVEQTIVYKNGMRVTPSTYLSMLYNVNLTRTGWNQTFKDARYFDKDILVLVPHPLSCPHCLQYQGKLFSLSGKRYPKIDEAYEHGVGHPNCKCEFSIVWDKDQLYMEYPVETTEDDYKEDQKRKATERELRKAENDLSMYQMIGNGEMVDKTLMKVERLKSKL